MESLKITILVEKYDETQVEAWASADVEGVSYIHHTGPMAYGEEAAECALASLFWQLTSAIASAPEQVSV